MSSINTFHFVRERENMLNFRGCCHPSGGRFFSLYSTLPETSGSPLKIGRAPKGNSSSNQVSMLVSGKVPPPKTNMTMENPPFEDVFPIENWYFCNVMLVFREGSTRCFRLFAEVQSSKWASTRHSLPTYATSHRWPKPNGEGGQPPVVG